MRNSFAAAFAKKLRNGFCGSSKFILQLLLIMRASVLATVRRRHRSLLPLCCYKLRFPVEPCSLARDWSKRERELCVIELMFVSVNSERGVWQCVVVLSSAVGDEMESTRSRRRLESSRDGEGTLRAAAASHERAKSAQERFSRCCGFRAPRLAWQNLANCLPLLLNPQRSNMICASGDAGGSGCQCWVACVCLLIGQPSTTPQSRADLLTSLTPASLMKSNQIWLHLQ